MNSILKQNGIHQVLLPREIVTGKKFRCPTIKIGQYVQGHTGSTNEVEDYRTIDSLYLGRTGGGNGHFAFKLDTQKMVTVPIVAVIPTPDNIINFLNKIGNDQSQPE